MVLAQAILEANTIYETLKENGMLFNVNLTVPEALQYTRKLNLRLIEWVWGIYHLDFTKM